MDLNFFLNDNTLEGKVPKECIIAEIQFEDTL